MNSSYKKSNKGFYAVLAIALSAIIASTVIITYTSSKLTTKKKSTTAPSSEIVISENANIPKTDIPDTRENTTSDAESKIETTAENSTEKTTENNAEKTTEKAVNDISCCLPVGTEILKDYSNGTMVKSKTMNDWRIHNGVDFIGETGDEVHSVYDGKVTKVSTDSMWGKTIEIDHGNGMTAKYCGLDEINVKENDEVKKDQVIGTLGTIPIESADNTHLHLEITLNGKITDPIAALGKETDSE